MHEHHDEALILDLLEMSVTDTEAESRLDGCRQCIADFAEQRSIAGYLGRLDPETMTPSERSELRSAVFAELGSGGTVVQMLPRRGFDWMRVGTVAAALVGVVAVAGLFSVLSDGTDGGQALDEAATITSGDDAEASAEAPVDEERSFEGLAVEESAADSAAIAAPSNLVRDLGAVDVPTFKSELDRIRGEVTDMTESSPVLQSDADRVPIECLGELSDRGSIRAIVTALVDGFEVEAYIDDDGGDYLYASIDCSTYELP